MASSLKRPRAGIFMSITMYLDITFMTVCDIDSSNQQKCSYTFVYSVYSNLIKTYKQICLCVF